MKIAGLLMLTLVACSSAQLDPEVERCEQSALDFCARIGYAGNDVCYVTLAQRCSPEDAAAAHEMCLMISPEADPCVLSWR